MKFEPINDRVLLRVIDEEETSKGGIILPTGSTTATVVAVGPGAWSPNVAGRIPMSLKAGDKVALPKRFREHCEEVLHEDVKHYVTTEQIVLGRVQA